MIEGNRDKEILEHLPLESLRVFKQICEDAGIDIAQNKIVKIRENPENRHKHSNIIYPQRGVRGRGETSFPSNLDEFWDKKVGKALELLEGGVNDEEIAEELNLTLSAVCKLRKKYKSERTHLIKDIQKKLVDMAKYDLLGALKIVEDMKKEEGNKIVEVYLGGIPKRLINMELDRLDMYCKGETDGYIAKNQYATIKSVECWRNHYDLLSGLHRKGINYRFVPRKGPNAYEYRDLARERHEYQEKYKIERIERRKKRIKRIFAELSISSPQDSLELLKELATMKFEKGEENK